MIDRETVIQKCFGISAITNARGQASLKKNNEKQIAKYEAELDLLIKKLVDYIKGDS